MHWPQQFLNFTTSEGTVSTESAGPLCVLNLAIQPGHTTRAENASGDDLLSLALSRFTIVQLGHRVGPPTPHAADRRTAAAAPRHRPRGRRLLGQSTVLTGFRPKPYGAPSFTAADRPDGAGPEATHRGQHRGGNRASRCTASYYRGSACTGSETGQAKTC